VCHGGPGLAGSGNPLDEAVPKETATAFPATTAQGNSADTGEKTVSRKSSGETIPASRPLRKVHDAVAVAVQVATPTRTGCPADFT
jgi:hypothetical protein